MDQITLQIILVDNLIINLKMIDKQWLESLGSDQVWTTLSLNHFFYRVLYQNEFLKRSNKSWPTKKQKLEFLLETLYTLFLVKFSFSGMPMVNQNLITTLSNSLKKYLRFVTSKITTISSNHIFSSPQKLKSSSDSSKKTAKSIVNPQEALMTQVIMPLSLTRPDTT